MLCLHYVDVIPYTTVVTLRIQRLSNYGVQLRQRSLVRPQAAEYPEYDSQGGTGSLHFGCLQWQRRFYVATNRVWKICVLRGVTFCNDCKLGRVDSQSGEYSVCCSVVLVISPLISLMVDQVLSLRRRGVHTSIISYGTGVKRELLATEDDLGKCSLLFCAPEALVGSRWREAIEKPVISDRIVAVVMDEAH